MSTPFLNQAPVSETEFIALDAKREELRNQVVLLLEALKRTEDRFNLLKAIYEPRINVIEVNNKSMGHRYIGRFSIPTEFGAPKRFTISLSKAQDFPDKDHPELLKMAKRKSIELLMRKHPELFEKKID